MPGLKLLFALHDVTPFHRARIERAEACFEQWGIQKATYLLIPNYHGANPVQQPEFAAWSGRQRPFSVEWFLHGYYHLQGSARELENGHQPVPAGPNVDEAEFGRLSGIEIEDRLERGCQILEAFLGSRPTGFVAPKWTFQQRLLPALKERNFAWTESYRWISHLPSGTRWPSPVVTWATRTRWRKLISLWGAPLWARLWQGSSLLRIAVHPFDFDHPQIVQGIDHVVKQAVRHREQVHYRDILPARTP